MALHNFMKSIYLKIYDKNIQNVTGLFLDIRKASDTVDHGMLLGKLEAAVVRETAPKCFSSYLTNFYFALALRRGKANGLVLGASWHVVWDFHFR